MSCTHIILKHTLTHRSSRLLRNSVWSNSRSCYYLGCRVKKKTLYSLLTNLNGALLSSLPIYFASAYSHPCFPHPWWHLWLTGWCSPYLDEKRKNRTVKMHTSPCILQRGHAAAVLASVPVFAQMRWQASCGNYTPAALESIGTCALISRIKWEFVLTFLETLHW